MKKLLIAFLTIILLVSGFFIYINYDKKKVNNNKEENVKIDKEDKLDIKKDLFEDYYDYADLLLQDMSLEEKIGQLFLVRYNKDLASSWIEKFNLGGFVLFAKDFESHTKQSITDEINSLKNISNIPLVFAVDEEGGVVTRVSRYNNFRSSKFLSPREIYNEGGYELLEKQEREKALLLSSLGINLNLAPVVDISVDSNDFIYNRSFGKDAKETAIFSKNMVSYFNSQNMSSCLKHFPGYGNNVDTHNGIAIDNRSYDSFVNNDFLPFKSGIEEGVPTVLVSHNIINCMDSEYPATLSKKVISKLRQELEFSGIIITDDLAMDAVLEYVLDGSAAVLAINAGNDMIITSDFDTMYNIVLKAVEEGRISNDTINKAVRRILAWKKAYNM